ncbi:MAG: amidohydrolase family protein [Planctomycetota bacterium]
MIIDAHHHFWQYTTEEFGWIDDSMADLRRDFGPPELAEAMDRVGVDAAVSVQARESTIETDWLLEIANRNDRIAGVVGWVPLASPDIDKVLDGYAASPKLKGVRHVVQGQPAGFLDADAFNHGVSRLARHDLAYDVLIFENQLPEAIRFVDRHPGLRFVLDHIAKPRIAEGSFNDWAKHLGALAEREHVTCKLSGMVTEANWSMWTPDTLRPYVDRVLEAFGPSRVMFGSDWPVCLVAAEYERWFEAVASWIAPLTETERADILGHTAIRAYQLEAHA